MKSTSPKDKDSQQNDELRNAGIAGLSAETVNRYGSAIKEHFVAYSGKDNEIGQTLKRSLQDIADSKINPQYQKQNLRQQAGFSAEIKETARYNAKKIVEGSGERKIRTDDLGQVNDPLYDHLTLDQNGNIVAGSGAQMKFVGSNPKEAFEKLISKKYAKYRQAIMLDGKKTPEEKNKFKKICESTGVSEQDRINAILYYDDHITADDTNRLPQIAVALRELIAKIQSDPGFRHQAESHPNNLLPIYGAILWNLIDLGYSDTEICDEEKGFISILAEAWNFPKADLLQMYDTAETLMDLSRKKVWLKQTDLPYLPSFMACRCWALIFLAISIA